MQTYRLRTLEESKAKVNEQIKKTRDWLSKNKWKSTVTDERREYTKKLSYFEQIRDLIRNGPKQKKIVEGLSFTGLKSLSSIEILEIEKQSQNIFRKVRRKFKTSKMKVSVKTAATKGKRKRFTINIKVTQDRASLASAKQTDWDLARTLHKTISNLEQKLQHKYKTEGHKFKRLFS